MNKIASLSILAALAGSTLVAQDSKKSDIVDTAVAAGSFKTLATALQAAGLVDALKGKGPFTVFAPTDAAFAKLPKGTLKMLLTKKGKAALTDILTYHVVPGKLMAKKVVGSKGLVTLNGQRAAVDVSDAGVMISGAKVVQTDIQCSNGVIHVIDSVITPVTDNVLQVAAGAGSFKTLAAAINAAGLAETLSSKGPFTVFAPTDAAFAKLPKGTVESLLKPENKKKLVSILTYHVVPGRNYAAKVVSVPALKSVQGSKIKFQVKKNGTAMAGTAKIVKTDINASNGVIHVLDSVILPPAGR